MDSARFVSLYNDGRHFYHIWEIQNMNDNTSTGRKEFVYELII